MTSTSRVVEARIAALITVDQVDQATALLAMQVEAERQGIEFLPKENRYDPDEKAKVRPPYKMWRSLDTDELVIQQWSPD